MYKLSELVLRVSECVEAVSEWCRSVSIDTSVGHMSIVSKSVQVSIDTSVKVSSRGSTRVRQVLRVPKCSDVEADVEVGRDIPRRAHNALVGLSYHCVDGSKVGPECARRAFAIIRSVA